MVLHPFLSFLFLSIFFDLLWVGVGGGVNIYIVVLFDVLSQCSFSLNMILIGCERK